MLSDPEERRRQRKSEIARRQRRRRIQTLKAFLRLAAAFVVLIACGVLIFMLAKDAKDPTISTDPTETTAGPTLPPYTTIHYAAVGDLNINGATVAAGGTSYDYTQAFMDIAHLLSNADISSVNFEGNLCGEPYGDNHSAPKTMAEALKKAGVDLVQMANSYAINRGLSGLAASLDGIRSAGMEPLGAYVNNAAFKESKGYTIRDVNGIKMAFVAFTKGMDGMALPEGSENCVNVLYSDYDSAYQEVDTKKITSILSAVNREKPDIVIALLHWGSEFNDTISKSQKKIVTLMQEQGVDAIIGTHSHYVQQMTLNESGQFVAYSLGDFFSDGKRAGSEYSVVLDLEITKNNVTGETKITGFTYTPIFSVHEEDKPGRVMRIREAIAAYENNHIDRVSQKTYNEMCYALQRIESRIAGE